MKNIKEFKGIWIPAEIWEKEDLSVLDKILLSEIIFLDKGPGCRASNEHFSNLLKINESNVKKHIKKLKDLKYIEQISFDGRTRYLKSSQKNMIDLYQKRAVRMGSIYTSAVSQNKLLPDQNKIISIENNIENNIEIFLKNKKKFLKFLERLGILDKKTTKKTKSKIYNEDSIQYQLANFLYREIEKEDPLFTEPNLNKWASVMNLILYVDNKSPDEIKKIIIWAIKDNFHKNLIIDPYYLRRKYEQLRKFMINNHVNNNKKESIFDRILKNET